MSPSFVSAVSRLLDSEACVVATVHRHASGFPARVRERPDAELLTVTPENRSRLANDLERALQDGIR